MAIQSGENPRVIEQKLSTLSAAETAQRTGREIAMAIRRSTSWRAGMGCELRRYDVAAAHFFHHARFL